jgi:hypothetical protein
MLRVWTPFPQPAKSDREHVQFVLTAGQHWCREPAAGM